MLFRSNVVGTQMEVLDFRKERGLYENFYPLCSKMIMGKDYAGDGFDELAVGDHFGQLGAVVFFNFPGFGKQVGILDFKNFFILNTFKQDLFFWRKVFSFIAIVFTVVTKFLPVLNLILHVV